MIEKNQIYQTEITDITEDGNGVGRVDSGFCVFTPKTAVGDICEIRIVKVAKNYAFGKLERIIKPSPDRVENICPAFGKCGGCTLRHISYEAELRLKQNMVYNNLKRIGKITDCEFLPIIAGSEPEHYRNKAQIPLAMNEKEVIAGFFAKRSHDVVDMDKCDLQPEIFNDIIRKFKAFVKKYNISIYDEERHSGLLRHVFLRNTINGDIAACFVINGKVMPEQDKLMALLTSEFPMIKSIVLNFNREKTNVILGEECKIIWGEPYITDILCGLKFNISPQSFYQVNHDGAEKLYKKAAEFAALSGSETVLDLYCGAGTIGLSVANMAKKLIGVEIIPEACDNARQNASQNGIKNAEFICADASDAAKMLKKRGVMPDVVIVDPPRKGCEEELLKTICEFAPKRIVMVSCNSATLARDLLYMEQNGYKAIKAVPVDLFARTMHVECVCLLTKTDR